MLKKILLFVLILWGVTFQAQTTQSKNRLFLGNGTKQEIEVNNNKFLNLQIGGTLLFQRKVSDNISSYIGFPYSILYLPKTFVVGKTIISKGFYADEVRLDWEIGANRDNIDKIQILRRELGSDLPFLPIANVAKDIYTYSDTQTDTGKLYEYKIKAEGISNIEEEFLTYVQGVGFRNPTATVSGSVNYEGGNPVKDVTVFAEAVGAENTDGGKSITFTNTFATTGPLRTPIKANAVTFQTWAGLNTALKTGTNFTFTTNQGKVVNTVFSLVKEDDKLVVTSKVGSTPLLNLTLTKSLPTGEIDAFGNDIYKKIADFKASEFIHFSIVLEDGKAPIVYVNGRSITEESIQQASTNLDESLAPSLVLVANLDTYTVNNTEKVQQCTFKSEETWHLDEFRVWEKALTAAEIRRDFRRYLSGGEPGLKVYLRADEGAGNMLYDLSKNGFVYNENHASILINNGGSFSFSNKVPKRSQLGVFGVTDSSGTYTIAAIPYKGNGESFKVTPSLGVHEFSPATQTLFLGKDEPVANQVDFTDVSSFAFRGKVVYNVQGVFNPLEQKDPSTLRDSENYNQYLNNGVPINKGRFYYEGGTKNPETGFYEGGALKEYPVVEVEGANIYIDGNLVFDEDNQPVVTDAEGKFKIAVPIGNHKVEVKKEGHVFALNGRFPETGTFEFFEDQIETRWFIDTTRVSLVGRVVGGKKEFEKPIGFGFDGAFTHKNFEDTTEETTETISSNNNIGVAQITFKGDLNSPSLDKIIATNSVTGEYQVDLIPYQYSIQQSGISIASNTDISLLTATETLDLREVPALETTTHTTEDGTKYTSDPYHYVKSFRYNSPVSFAFLRQTHENNITIEENTYDISGLAVPIYMQRKRYDVFFEVSQNYVNKDGDEDVVTKEFFTDGELRVTNNLAISGSEKVVLEKNNTEYKYSFMAGIPNISHTDGFKKGMTVQYVIEGQNPLSLPDTTSFKSEGIIKGGAPTSGTTFSTVAPEVPDIILRDPPGSNSFASIEKGTSISFEKSYSNQVNSSIGGGVFVSAGADVRISVGVLGFLTNTEVSVVAEEERSMSLAVENTRENTTSNTYTFNQTISTSDDPDYVGADGDLYIGNAKNVYYGMINNMIISEETLKDNDNNTIPSIEISVTTKDDVSKTLHISNVKDFFIAEQPTNTFFAYSQKNIIENVIPNLLELAANVDANAEDVEPHKTPEFYLGQADLWRRVIQNNEKMKYDALTDKNALQQRVLGSVSSRYRNLQNTLKDLIRENFFSNKSFDAGLGELTNNITTSAVRSSSVEYAIELSNEASSVRGAFVNENGGSITISSSTGYTNTNNSTTLQELTTNISYTFKDNDDANFLSVDVINAFDGNGPVFVIKGGATSCPYEGETTSIFFKNQDFDAAVIGEGGESLSVATNNVYTSEITVEKALLSNVPESDAAIFTLYLKNNSETQTDLEFGLHVDATSLNGLSSNIRSSGVNVFLPFNETIEFPFEVRKTSSSSVYNYENIRVFLKSPCDQIDSYQDYVDVSVEFKKSCSKVALSAPQNNWVFNINEAYSVDIEGNRTINKLPISFTDFNTDFAGFRKIELQYRNASASTWSKFATYYGSEELKDTAGDLEGFVIGTSDAEFTYNWDIVGENIPDGDYEFRAISYCTDNITNESAIVSGTINLNAPVVFGTPKPTDGILDVGEDISVRFNEDIFERITTTIDVVGLKNQQEIDHSVSVQLDGSSRKIELPNQRLSNHSFALQFWFNNATTGVGSLVSQENGIEIGIDGNHLDFSVGGKTVSTKTRNTPLNASQYNFYSFVYQDGTDPQLLIIENGEILENLTLENPLDINTSSSLFIGGQNVKGNIHDVRIWAKSFTRAQATVAKDLTLTGRELNLLGYWKLDEGHGSTGLDKAKRKNAIVALDWAIFPKGTGYAFENNEYLSLNSVGFIQPTDQEDVTLSFWIKPSATSSGTIFSNGKGDDSEPVLTNGYRNKWAINMETDGHLVLVTENKTYPITSNVLASDKWSHIALTLRRGASLNAFVNGKQEVSVNAATIGGFTGNKILVGARLFEDLSGNITIDNHFTGILDELRFWNTARSIDQIQRDRYFEIDKESTGLLLYMDFNEDTTNRDKGPAYHHADINLTTSTTFSVLSTGASQNYKEDSPPIKPPLKLTNIPFNTVINGDEMIIEPNLTEEEWRLFEGEVITFTVARLSDMHFNTQLSPVTWSVLVNQQELEWFTEDNTKEVVAQKTAGDPYSFTMDLINVGNSNQPFTISGVPTWMQAEVTSGSISPNSTRQITFTVDADLAMGSYASEIFLETASTYNDRLSFSLRVLADAPDWSVNAAAYSNSMNVIGKIQLDGVFSRDQYTKVGAFVNNQPRGEAYLVYDSFYDTYFAYLTIYSNAATANLGEQVTFKIWDAINGKTLVAAIDNTAAINLLSNEVLGSNSNPKIFSATNLSEQNLPLNEGWSWVSFFVDDERLGTISEELFSTLTLEDGDVIKSQSKFLIREGEFWEGNIEALEAEKMYKVKMANSNTLPLKGPEIDSNTYTVSIFGKADENDTPKWNWLPYPIHRNVALVEALAFYNPTDGDVIKDQFNFAIYNESSGWRGTLNYLEPGHGYMLKSSTTQTFNYPNSQILQKTANKKTIVASKNDYEAGFAQYSSNMNIVAEVIADTDFNKVHVYDTNNVLRGLAEITTINDKKYSFITAFSNTVETLKFVLVNDYEALDINTKFTFKDNEVLGDFDTPLQLSANALDTETMELTNTTLYPNPFTNTIFIDLSSQTGATSKVEVFNAIGVKVLTKKVSVVQKLELNTTNLPQGVYLIRLSDTSGKFAIKKMIKE